MPRLAGSAAHPIFAPSGRPASSSPRPVPWATSRRPYHPQNLALNVAEKGFPISVYNRSSEKTDAAVARAGKEGVGERLHGYKDIKEFVASLERPRWVLGLVPNFIADCKLPAGPAWAHRVFPRRDHRATITSRCRSASPRDLSTLDLPPLAPLPPAQARGDPGQGRRPGGLHHCRAVQVHGAGGHHRGRRQ